MWGNPKGMTAPGNIDLRQLHSVKSPDGGWGTVYSSNNEVNGKETVYPGLVNGHYLSDDAAYKNAEQTGRHLGQFSNPQDASNYAQKLHEDWEKGLIPGVASRNTPIIGAPYPSIQYEPLSQKIPMPKKTLIPNNHLK